MEKQKEERKVWLYGFVFLIFGLVLGLVIFNSNITGNPIFNLQKITLNPVDIESTATTSSTLKAPSENMLAMMDVVQGMSRTVDFSKMTAQEWTALKDYAEFSSLVTKTWTKDNVAKNGEEGTLELFNQKLKESKSTNLVSKTYAFVSGDETTSQTLSKASIGGSGGNQILTIADGCSCGARCCCTWSYGWFGGVSCEGWMMGD